MDESLPPVILTIEDEPTIRDSFRSYLEDLEYRVLEASDGTAGLDAFRRHQPDLVLLDLHMPGVDGIEVLAHIRKISPDTPVIIISGTGLIDNVVAALRRGAQDYLLKPVEDLSILKHAVEGCLERARLIRENRQYQQKLEEKVSERTRDLATANQRLRKSEEKYRLLFETMRNGLALCRPEKGARTGRLDNYRLAEVNPAFETMTGIEANRLKNRSLASLFPGLDFQQAEKNADDFSGYHIEHHDPHQDRHFEMLVYRRTSGELVLMMADLTERHRLKEELQQAQKMEAIGTLAGGIAHDFNNILGALLGYGELALLDLPSNHPVRQKVEQMLGSCHRAKDLVSRILSFSRRAEHDRRPVRVDQVVEEALQLLRAALPTTIDIHTQVDGDGATVAADPTQIHQIVMNLCTNAHHAMRETGGVLSVTVNTVNSKNMPPDEAPALPAGEYVCLSVRDTGSGMDNRILQRVFDPYFTTKAKGEGTGLGLSVVHGLVKNWGGEIEVDSVPGKGTRFSVFIPCIDASHVSVDEPVASGMSGNGQVLLVDDEKALVLVGQKMLEHAGYAVNTFTCPQKALARFESTPDAFDLVITDMTMPKLTGDRLARSIHRIRPDIPVILCTGYQEVMEKAMSGESDFSAVLLKPMVMDALLNAVGSALKDAGKGRSHEF